jgi:hypothetical protein
MWPCIVTNFFVIKPTRCTNFINLFCHETLHVSNSSSVLHQEFIHYTLSKLVHLVGFITKKQEITVLNFIELDNLKFVECLKLNSSVFCIHVAITWPPLPRGGLTPPTPTPTNYSPTSQDRNEYECNYWLCVPKQREERTVNADRMNDTTCL